MKLRFINTGSRNLYENMAIDEALLEKCEVPTLRVYAWDKPSISAGYNQDVSKEINLEECKKNNISVVRRLTGGKAVFHDKEITYSFILPENSLNLSKDVVESYKVIANALVIALDKIGIKADVSKQAEKLSDANCFNSSNWYELLVNGKKISGSAQKRMNGKILQHGSILIDFDHSMNAKLFRGDVDLLKKRITSIKNEIGKGISYDELREAIKKGFRENFKCEIFDDSLSEDEIKISEKLLKEKYSTEEWNFKN